jgi:TonB family protein
MVPQTQKRNSRNSSKVNLIISLVFHGLIIVALVYFAAREGVLGKQIKKLAVSMVHEKPPDKPKTPDKPKEDVPKVDVPKLTVAPKMSEPKEAPTTTASVAPPTSAPPATEIPNFYVPGGREVVTADAVTVYKSEIEETLKAKWNRPEDMADSGYVAEVDISVSPDGQLSNPAWVKGSGNQRWDDSVKAALAATTSLPLPPPKNFPSHVTVRFDVAEEQQQIMP